MVSEIPGFHHQPITIIITIILTSVTIIITCREGWCYHFLETGFPDTL
jgi:hypothetical protein